MKKYKLIIQDAIILLVVSTVFVTVVNQSFKKLKKNTAGDSLVTVILQNNADGAKEVLGEKGLKDEGKPSQSLPDYIKERVNRPNEFGRTPLIWACYANYDDAKLTAETDAKRRPIVDLLVQNGADVNARDNDGWTPLMWAAWSGLTGMAQRLTELGANLNAVDRQGQSALMLAALRGNGAVVKLLIEKNADRTLVAKNGKRALDFAEEARSQYPHREKAYESLLPVLR